MYASDEDWDEFFLTDINLYLKYTNRRRRSMDASALGIKN
jgi:hypothetical protein